MEAWGAAPRLPWREDAIPPGMGANLLFAPHRAVSAARDNSGVCWSGCHCHRGIGVLPGAQGKGCHTPAQRGSLGSTVSVGSGGIRGCWVHSYLIFKKGNILFLYVFINSSTCAPWHFYTPSQSPLWACATPPSAVSPTFPVPTPVFPSMLSSPLPVPPMPSAITAAPAGAVHVLVILVLPPEM